MKKKIIGLAFTIAVVSALSTAAYASTYVNNEDVTSSVFTSSSNGYTLFPVRYLGEKLGCDVYWNPDDKCITVSKDDIHRDFYNGSAAVYDWAGNSYNLVTAPKFVDGNTMVPAEFYRDQFGISVIWDDVTCSLFINSENTYNWLVDTAEYKDAKKRKNQLTQDQARDRLYNWYDPIYQPDLRINYEGENSEYYYFWVLWHNEVTGMNNNWGEYKVNKNTGAISKK